MAKIIQKENKVLRQRAKDILVHDIKSPKIKKIIADMKKALDDFTNLDSKKK